MGLEGGEGIKMDAKDAFPIVWCAFEQSKRDDEKVMMKNKKKYTRSISK